MIIFGTHLASGNFVVPYNYVTPLFCSPKLIETRADGVLAKPLPADLNVLYLDYARGDCLHGYNDGNRKGACGDYGCDFTIPFVCEGHSAQLNF